MDIPIDPFIIKLILSFLVGGLYIAFTIFISEKFSSKIGGIILGLPSTTMMSLIFISWTQDVSAVMTMLPSIPAAFSIGAFFAAVFILVYSGHSRMVAFLTAIVVWAFLNICLILLVPDIFFSIAFAIVFCALSILMLGKYPPIEVPKSSISTGGFIFRSVFAGAVISAAVLLGKVLSPLWGAMFAVFPAAFSSSLYLLSSKHGFGFTASVARTMPHGLIASIFFVIALFLLIPTFGFVVSLVISYTISLVCAVLIYLFVLSKEVNK